MERIATAVAMKQRQRIWRLIVRQDQIIARRRTDGDVVRAFKAFAHDALPSAEHVDAYPKRPVGRLR
jgi:hypothetical protein